MKKKLTAEQEAARAARREKFRGLVKQVAEMPEEKRVELAMRAGAVLTCQGRALSRINTILCFMQCPGVSMVGGFRQWLGAGRCVRKGEHGMNIWIPLGVGAGDRAQAEAEASSEAGSGQRFGTATVFDVSQTAELEPEHPVATVAPEIAAAFGLSHLPNVRTFEALEV